MRPVSFNSYAALTDAEFKSLDVPDHTETPANTRISVEVDKMATIPEDLALADLPDTREALPDDSRANAVKRGLAEIAAKNPGSQADTAPEVDPPARNVHVVAAHAGAESEALVELKEVLAIYPIPAEYREDAIKRYVQQALKTEPSQLATVLPLLCERLKECEADDEEFAKVVIQMLTHCPLSEMPASAMTAAVRLCSNLASNLNYGRQVLGLLAAFHPHTLSAFCFVLTTRGDQRLLLAAVLRSVHANAAAEAVFPGEDGAGLSQNLRMQIAHADRATLLNMIDLPGLPHELIGEVADELLRRTKNGLSIDVSNLLGATRRSELNWAENFRERGELTETPGSFIDPNAQRTRRTREQVVMDAQSELEASRASIPVLIEKFEKVGLPASMVTEALKDYI